MSSGPLPPLPDLIPIALLKSNTSRSRESAPRVEVMGEQRPRRTAAQPPADLIDSGKSRGTSAAPQPPQSRKARSDRHRKSDRRREHHKAARTKNNAAASANKSRDTSTSSERPANPRVNPIFVWVRQEDTRIVDVKCEDYDKRNRILLTKTAQGWRAIPRTETLVPTLKEPADISLISAHHHHHHHRRRSRKSKVRRRSAAVQVDSDIQDLDQDDDRPLSPTWTSPVNVESHLPSHKIHVPKKCPSPIIIDTPSVNSGVNESAQTPDKCSVAKMCDVSPLDNLLAVAEFEFNQHMQSGQWNNETPSNNDDIDDIDEQKEFINNIIESFPQSADDTEDKLGALSDQIDTQESKTDDCDYTEDDDNNIAMDDILSRLEQSLRSPECLSPSAISDTKIDDDNNINKQQSDESLQISDINENNYKTVPEDLNYFDADKILEETCATIDNNNKTTSNNDEILDDIVESSTTVNEDEPTDLSLKSTNYEDNDNECNNSTDDDHPEQPTDLTLPKNGENLIATPRPPSQNSEAIQSPQPSGIPAVPPSPDIVVSTSANNSNCKSKSVFLESLLTTSSQKIALNSEVTIIRQKEPLDLGKCRKSASPTVTCSEEVQNANLADSEPPNKKFKSDDITLKNLLDLESMKTAEGNEAKTTTKSPSPPETPRLLELLKTDSSGPDPLMQLRQILYDTNLNVPDPMLVPKERLSQIISHPGREIPRLLKQRPELRLPEALAFPHLLQDPDILVITLQQLETIILKQNQSLNLKDIKGAIAGDKNHHQEKGVSKRADKSEIRAENSKKRQEEKAIHENSQSSKCGFNELASDIDAATTAAFNQMIWLPYLNQLEAMSFGNNPEMMKMLSNSLPMYPGQLAELNPLVGGGARFPHPVGFAAMQQPQINYNNNLELSMWQEAMIQANMLRPKVPLENLSHKNSFRDYLDKLNFPKPNMGHHNKMPMMAKPNLPNFYPSSTTNSSYHQNSFFNFPGTQQQQQQQQQQKQSLQIPQYNSMFNAHSKNSQHKHHHSHMASKQQAKFDVAAAASKSNYANFYHHQRLMEDKQHHKPHQEPPNRPKLSCKSFANIAGYQQKERAASGDFSKHHHHQPIDLSGSTAPTTKLKVKQHLIDPANAPKLLKHDDIPEVGSTTASVEEMQDAHKHLWHPLFGNQKGYHNPWNWTTVTATGE